MLNPGPFCGMMEERKSSLIKWPSPTVDKTCREQTRICRLTRRKIFLKPIKYEQLVSHAKNKLHFFSLLLYLCCCCLFSFAKEFFYGGIKAHPPALRNGNARRGKRVGVNAGKRVSRRGGANVRGGETESLYRVLVTAGEVLTHRLRV